MNTVEKFLHIAEKINTKWGKNSKCNYSNGDWKKQPDSYDSIIPFFAQIGAVNDGIKIRVI